MIEDSLNKVHRICNDDPVIGKNMVLVREVTMLQSLVGQMSKFMNILNINAPNGDVPTLR